MTPDESFEQWWKHKDDNTLVLKNCVTYNTGDGFRATEIGRDANDPKTAARNAYLAATRATALRCVKVVGQHVSAGSANLCAQAIKREFGL